MSGGCESPKRSSQHDNIPKITFIKDLSVPLNTPEALAGDFSGLAVDSRGIMYAADSRLMKVHLFSSEGKYLDSLGRKGKGPGEFSWLGSQLKIQSDTLYILDKKNWRISMFRLSDRGFAGAIDIPKEKIEGKDMGSPRELFPLANGQMMVLFVGSYYRDPDETGLSRQMTVSVIDKSGTFLTKKLLQFPTLFPTNQKLAHMDGARMSVFTAPFYPFFEAVTDNRGHLYVGRSDSLILQEYNRHGSLLGSLRADFLGPVVTKTDIDSISDQKGELFGKLVHEVGKPSNWPAFQHVLFDDANRAWVQLVAPGKSNQIWIIFGKDHTVKWKGELPAEISLYAVQNDKAYGISRGPGALPEIVRFKIDGMVKNR